MLWEYASIVCRDESAYRRYRDSFLDSTSLPGSQTETPAEVLSETQNMAMQNFSK